MSNPVETEILSNLAIIIEALKEKKGKEIITIDLAKVEYAICDYFIICHGTSTTQVDALTDWVLRKLKTEKRVSAHHVEGTDNMQWVLIDYGELLVHIFLEEKRLFYNLEELWEDGKITRIGDK